MLSKQEIKEYYKTARLQLKPLSKWRLYKIQTYEGKWKIINNQIRSAEQLRKILIKEAPINVFSSCSIWLNPLKIEKKSYKYADQLFLGNLVFIDIDEHNNKTLNKILKFFEKTSRYKLWKKVNSGNGYALYYVDTKNIIEPDPIKRRKLVTTERKELAEELKKEGIKFDWRMLIDPYRISRVIGTLNEGEKICHEISSSREAEKPMKGRDRKIPTPPQKIAQAIDRELDSWAHSKYYFYAAIDSQIHGIKDKHCVYIIKEKLYNYKKFIKSLKKLQSSYNLSDFYIFETKKHYTAICLKGVDKRRFLKILGRIKASNFNSFKKYAHSWIKISNSIGDKDEFKEDRPVFKEVIESSEYNDNYHSRPHLDYLTSIGVKTKRYNNLFGSKENKQIIAKVRI